MKLDRRLNFVIPIFEDKEGAERPRAYVHSAPIGREVFERYYLTLAKAFTSIFAEKLSFIAGPRVTALLIRDAAKATGDWDGPEGVENGFFKEMYRLTNVLAPSEKGGWESVPYEDARRMKIIDDEDAATVENALAFFTVVSAMLPRAEATGILEPASKLWGAQTSSSNSTEFKNSLPTSTEVESTGAKEPALRIAY